MNRSEAAIAAIYVVTVLVTLIVLTVVVVSLFYRGVQEWGGLFIFGVAATVWSLVYAYARLRKMNP